MPSDVLPEDMPESEGEAPEEFEFDSVTLVDIPEDEVVTIDMTFEANLADALEEAVLQDIGQERMDMYSSLKGSRQVWEEKVIKGIKWLGLNTDGEGNSEMEGACTAVHPLLMESVIKFQAKAIQEIWPAKGPVRTKIKGLVNKEREEAASRVRVYMNYQLTEQVTGFYADLERNLFRVGFLGLGIRKAGWNPLTGSPDPAIVFAENFYVDPSIGHLRDADEYIEEMELSPRKMTNLIASQAFRDLSEEDIEEALTPNEITEAITEAQGFSTRTDRMGFPSRRIPLLPRSGR
jgi:hypothetical protein